MLIAEQVTDKLKSDERKKQELNSIQGKTQSKNRK